MESKWNIVNLQSFSSTGTVVNVSYNVIFKLEDSTIRYSSDINLPVPPENDDEFIPYSDLTEELVITWVKSTLGDEKIAALENEYLLMLQEKSANTQEYSNGSPWRKSSEERIAKM